FDVQLQDHVADVLFTQKSGYTWEMVVAMCQSDVPTEPPDTTQLFAPNCLSVVSPVDVQVPRFAGQYRVVGGGLQRTHLSPLLHETKWDLAGRCWQLRKECLQRCLGVDELSEEDVDEDSRRKLPFTELVGRLYQEESEKPTDRKDRLQRHIALLEHCPYGVTLDNSGVNMMAGVADLIIEGKI
ncbi:unnamed protein product, partial [marine sediment metagenome]